jgi:hypothetical protein
MVAVPTSVSSSTSDSLRIRVGMLAVLWSVLTLGLYFNQPWITWIWPWHDQRMTFIFFASIAAAVAAPLAWIALTNEPAALSGMNLDGLVITSLVTVGLATMAVSRHEPRLLLYSVATGAAAMFSWSVFKQFRVVAPRDHTPQPIVVRVLFGLLVLALIPLGVTLIFRVSNVFPWDLPNRTSTMIGAVFIGAGTWFLVGVRKRMWAHSGGQLAGLLAYDLVLMLPYWRAVFDRNAISSIGGYGTFPGSDVVSPSNQANTTSLFVYTGVITISSVIAAFFLFVNPSTRIRWKMVLRPGD